MADIISQVTTILTGVTGWAGSLLTFAVAQPLIMIPTALGFIGSTIITIKALK